MPDAATKARRLFEDVRKLHTPDTLSASSAGAPAKSAGPVSSLGVVGGCDAMVRPSVSEALEFADDLKDVQDCHCDRCIIVLAAEVRKIRAFILAMHGRTVLSELSEPNVKLRDEPDRKIL